MLHSFHYYACYYALLWFLHQQQRAAAISMIIDGSSTNEWATRDEYQRLIADQTKLRQSEAALERQILAELDAGQSQAPLAADLAQEPEVGAGETLAADRNNPRLAVNAAGQVTAARASVADELGLVLDRLDLMEEQQRHSQRLKQLNQRHQAHLSQQQQQQQLSLSGQSGARSIGELVALGDEPLEPNAAMRMVERASAPHKYCGPRLTDVLQTVCQGRYYGGEFEPEVVQPIVKSKRFAEAELEADEREGEELAAGEQSGQPVDGNQMTPVARRRKLRTLDTDGSLESRNLNDVNNDDNTNHKQHYLSPTQISASSLAHSNNNENINNNNHNQHHQQPQTTKQANLIEPINSNIKPTLGRLTNRRNKHSKMLLYRRIRGVHQECCVNSCTLEEMKAYCKPMT